MSTRVPRRERIALVRMVVSMMPDDIDRRVSVRYMHNYTDLDIRDELEITKKRLMESRASIKKMLMDAGINYDK